MLDQTAPANPAAPAPIEPTTLPALGQITEEDHQRVRTYVDLLAREAYDARVVWDQVVDDNLQIYTYGTINPSDDKVINPEIQNAIIVGTDIQTKEPPAVMLDPVDSGEPPNLYWAGPADVAGELGLPEQCAIEWMDEAGQLQPPVPLPEELGRQLQQTPGIQPDWLVDVNDKLVSDIYQQVFDVYWQRSRIDRRLRSNLLKTNVQGWSIDLFEFDDDEQKVLLKPLTIKQVYIDPTCEDLDDAAYAIVDLVLDADEAKRIYPDIADTIAQWSRTGVPTRPDGLMTLGDNFNRDFKRKMLTLRICWLRNQPLDLPQPETAPAVGDIQAAGPDAGPSSSSSTRHRLRRRGTALRPPAAWRASPARSASSSRWWPATRFVSIGTSRCCTTSTSPSRQNPGASESRTAW
jgi:hypothetical protein